MEDAAMENATQGGEGRKKGKTIMVSIFGTHVKRIGFLRTFFGGFLMYVSVFEFVLIHLTAIVVLYQWLLAPFKALRKFRMRDYIILDRNRIEGMNAFDRFNCEFCGYANGSTRLWNDQIDSLASGGLGRGKVLLKLVAGLYALCLGICGIFTFVFSKLLFALISLFLGYQWASSEPTRRMIGDMDFAGSYGIVMRTLLRFGKIYAVTLATNLEQIESSWCPLKHREREGMVVPAHHANFYDRERLAEVVEVLSRDGTVSPRKPRY